MHRTTVLVEEEYIKTPSKLIPRVSRSMFISVETSPSDKSKSIPEASSKQSPSTSRSGSVKMVSFSRRISHGSNIECISGPIPLSKGIKELRQIYKRRVREPKVVSQEIIEEGVVSHTSNIDIIKTPAKRKETPQKRKHSLQDEECTSKSKEKEEI